MRTAALAALLLILAGPARAWRLWGEASDGKIRPVQALSDAHKTTEVLTALTPGSPVPQDHGGGVLTARCNRVAVR